MASPIDLMALSTIRVIAMNGSSQHGLGTGFLYAFPLAVPTAAQPHGTVVPILVTNRHVVGGCDSVRLRFTAAPKGAVRDAFGQPAVRNFHDVQVPLASLLVGHPDPEVDLCALLIGPIVNDIQQSGLEVTTLS